MALQIDRPAAHVVRFRINRPHKRNAIDHDVRQALTDGLLALQSDRDCRAIVLGGVDGVFSAGGDLPSMAGLDEAEARSRMQHIHRLCRLLADLRVPVVAAAEGFCAGGAVGLALLGDHIVVGEGSKILFPFLKLGLVPDWGMLHTLPSRLGVAQTKQVLTHGRIIRSDEALALGLVDEHVGDADVMGAAVARAESMAQLPQGAFAALKARLNHPSATLEEEWQREEDDQAGLLLSAEFREGFAAFNEKRPADFVRASGDQP